MSRKLSAANPYLRDPAVRKRAIFQSVASSSAIEGIHAPFRKMAAAPDKRKPASTDHRKRQPRTT
jgi:hypothetical protein